MNALHDILAERADAVVDTTHHERVGAVRRRIRSARRRRRAAAAGLAAVVVVLAGVALARPGHHRVQPADAPSRMVGHAVPTTTTSLGATYRYVRGVVGRDGHLTTTLPGGSGVYLVRMASADPHGMIALSEPGLPDEWTTPAGDFGESYEVRANETTRLSIRQRGGEGDVALAVYAFDRPAPGSYAKDGIVFAPTAAGQPLLGAWIGDPGESAHTLRISGLPARIDVHPVCGHLPRGTRLRVSFIGRPGMVAEATSCDGPPEHLPGEYGESDTVHVPDGVDALRIEAVDSHQDPVALPDDSRIGLGVYTTAYMRAQHGLTRFVDGAGHRWKLAHAYVAPAGQARASSTIDARTPTLVTYGSTHVREGDLVARIGKHRLTQLGPGGMSWGVVADGRRDTVVRLHYRGGGPGVQLVIGTYVLAD